LNNDLLKDFLLEAFPNPERKGCPGENTVKALAEDRLPANDPARLHLGSCSECYAEYLHYRQDWEESNPHSSENTTSGAITSQPISAWRRARLSLPIAASLLILCGGGFVAYRMQHIHSVSLIQTASDVPHNATVDLFDAGTVRGEGDSANTLQQVSLSASIVHLSVTLPRFSQPGQYAVLVSKDKAGDQIVAQGSAVTVEKDGKVALTLTLDLRSATPGAYFLATVQGADNRRYYYPLKIK
jgi:hypothetical protein